MSEALKAEFKHYLENQDELAEQYGGKYIAMKDSEVIGVYCDYLEAAEDVYNIKGHERGTVLMQEVHDRAKPPVTISTPGVVFDVVG